MTSLMKWQHFSCPGWYLQLLFFLNIRKLAISAQVALHISNAVWIYSHCILPVFQLEEYFSKFKYPELSLQLDIIIISLLQKSEGGTRPVCVSFIVSLLKKYISVEWLKKTEVLVCLHCSFFCDCRGGAAIPLLTWAPVLHSIGEALVPACV